MEVKPILLYRRYEDYNRIKSLGISIVHSYSEFMSSACTKFWYYKYFKCYQEKGFKKSLVYGSLFHLVVENIIVDVSRFDPEISTSQTFLDILKDKANELEEEFYNKCDGNYEIMALEEEIESCKERILNVIDGWFDLWMKNIHSRFNIVAVEKELIKPIFQEDGTQYTTSVVVQTLYDEENSDIVMIQSDDAFSGENTVIMNVPVYKIGKADVILQERSTGDLYILDHKTSGSPNMYKSKLKFDMQLQSYANLLRYEIEEGSMTEFKGCNIAGFIWDISHSKTPSPPKLLASGKLSTAKRAAPYWQYKKSIIQNNLNLEEYETHLEYLMTEAYKYVQMHEAPCSMDQIIQSAQEDLIYADRINSMRERLQRVSDVAHTSSIVARYPQCQSYNSCQFSAPCLANTPYNVILNEQAPMFSWLVKND